MFFIIYFEINFSIGSSRYYSTTILLFSPLTRIWWLWPATSSELQKSGFFRIQKFTPKVRDSRQLQPNKKCVIRDISILKRLKTVWNKRKQCKIPGNSVKQSQTKTLLVSSCCHKHLKKFSPPFITFSTRIFTPVGKSLHEQRSHRSHLFAALPIWSNLPTIMLT